MAERTWMVWARAGKLHNLLRLLLLGAAVGVGFGLRLALAHFTYGNEDEASYELVAAIARTGGNVYLSTHRYNYSPVWFYFLWTFSFISDWTGLAFHTVVRSFLTCIDAGNFLLIALISGRVFHGSGIRNGLCYWLNPVSIWLVGFQGQFEAFALFPLLFAVWLDSRPPPRLAKTALWALGSLALLLKHLTLPLVWALFYAKAGLRRSAILMALAMLVFLFSFLPFLPEGGQGIIEHVLLYKSTPGLYGAGALLPSIVAFSLFAVGIVLAPMIALTLLQLDLYQALHFSSLVLLTLIPGIGQQYFLIPILLGSIRPSRIYWATTAVVASFFFIGPIGSHNLIEMLRWNIVWLFMALWLVSYLVGPRPMPNPRLQVLRES